MGHYKAKSKVSGVGQKKRLASDRHAGSWSACKKKHVANSKKRSSNKLRLPQNAMICEGLLALKLAEKILVKLFGQILDPILRLSAPRCRLPANLIIIVIGSCNLVGD